MGFWGNSWDKDIEQMFEKCHDVKLDKYRVRGKKRWFDVIKIDGLDGTWAYECEERCYAIDAGPVDYQKICYGLAAIMNTPEVIFYLPIRKDSYGGSECFDAVLVRPELQLKRAEWISLRRQLNRAHKVPAYQLRYKPKNIYPFSTYRMEPDDESAKLRDIKVENARNRIKKRRKQELAIREGDTIFFTLLKESCANLVVGAEWLIPDAYDDEYYGMPIGGVFVDYFGWVLANRHTEEIKNYNGITFRD